MQQKNTKKKTQDKNHDEKKRTALWITLSIVAALIIALAIVAFFVLLFRGYIGNIISGPSTFSYQGYLEQKYGKSEGFYYVDTGNCVWFNNGSCDRIFSSDKVDGRKFEVTASRSQNGETKFSDDYALAIYGEELDKYFDNLLNDVFNDKFSLSFGVQNMKNLDSNVTFEELLNNFTFSITAKASQKDINIQDFDIEDAEQKIKKLMASNNIDSVKIEIIMDDTYTKTRCPDGYATYGNASRVSKCTATVYHIDP